MAMDEAKFSFFYVFWKAVKSSAILSETYRFCDNNTNAIKFPF